MSLILSEGGWVIEVGRGGKGREGEGAVMIRLFTESTPRPSQSISCNVHGMTKLCHIDFCRTQEGRPTPHFSIFACPSVRPLRPLRPSPRSNPGPWNILEHSGTWELRNSGIQELRNSGTQELRNSGTQELRNSGTQELRNSGINEHKN